MKNLKKIKQKSTNVIISTMKALRSVLDYVVDISLLFLVLTIVVVMGAKAPEIHSKLLRKSVGDKVYLITNKERTGSGTGFAIKADSGITYIVTNDHVCGLASSDGTISVIDKDKNVFSRRVIERSIYSDLCLVESAPGVEGLSLGSEPSVGQIIASVGHPSGYDLTFSRGEIIQQEDVFINAGIISITGPDGQVELTPKEMGGISEEECSKPKNVIAVNKVSVLNIFDIYVKTCVNKTDKAYLTNMLIQPGSSGSPIVNFWGHVVGVVFASDRAGWGVAVSFNDLTKLLKSY
jgi:S1-C subfamily serine protease